MGQVVTLQNYKNNKKEKLEEGIEILKNMDVLCEENKEMIYKQRDIVIRELKKEIERYS